MATGVNRGGVDREAGCGKTEGLHLGGQATVIKGQLKGLYEETHKCPLDNNEGEPHHRN